MSGLTAYFGLGEVGKAQAIYYASGVLAFGMCCVFLSLRIAQILGMFQRLSVAAVGVGNFSMNQNQTVITHLNAAFTLRNDSQRIMFYKLKRVHLSIETIGPKDLSVDESLVIIAPFGGIQSVNCATLQNIPTPKGGPAPTGHLEVQVLYGDDKDSLHYLFTYKAVVNVLLMKVNKELQATMSTQLKLLHHERA